MNAFESMKSIVAAFYFFEDDQMPLNLRNRMLKASETLDVEELNCVYKELPKNSCEHVRRQLDSIRKNLKRMKDNMPQ